MSLPLIKRLTKQLATALVVLAMISSDSIGQAPDLEKGLPPQAKPRITNSIGMTMATMDSHVEPSDSR